MFTCVLNTTDTNITTNNDVQWYRFIKSTGTTVMVDQHGKSISFITNTTGNTTTSTLIVTNARTSHTGYFWLETPSCNVCSAAVIVKEIGMYVRMYVS